MKNILFPTDFSENAWNALRYAQQLFKETKCNFYVLHVSEFTAYPVIPVSLENQGEAQAEEFTIPSKEQLHDWMTRIGPTNTNAEHKFYSVHEFGFFLEAIKKNLTNRNIDLIIMGTKGVSGLRQRIIGSNAGDVITKVKCNTLIIPRGAKYANPQEVAFPTDYNLFYSHNILEALTEMLGFCQGSIRVMNVSKTDKELTKAQKKNQEYLLDYFKDTLPKNHSFHTITNRNVNAAIQNFSESRDVDMIFMVAKNLNFLQHVLFDSLVEKISFNITVPFFVIHE